jgi:type II secretory ATPase GspE/PulE/Tfp pilus assembly ATPase PilB-like protein
MPSIDDLLKNYQGKSSSTPYVAAKEVADKFSEKMQQIETKEKEKIIEEKAHELGVSYINLVGFPITPSTLGTITEEEAKRLMIACFLNTGSEIRIGAIDPIKPEIKELIFQIEERFHSHVAIYMISEHSLEYAMKLYSALPKFRKVVSGVELTGEQLEQFRKELTNFKTINEKLQKASLTDIFAMIIAGAMQAGSSDIHIEAEEYDIVVRYRIDGILQSVATLKKELWPRIISRVKSIAKLKINIEDIPQDGRITVFLGKGQEMDIRVSTLPSAYGESVVMRLLMSSLTGFNFDDLGIRGRAFEQLKRETERPNGMIITTGPTGSGKSTTLYAILSKLNEPGVKIITLEDPIEIKIKGITQSQIDHSKDYTFVSGLRSILRQDPDIVMVGEIRDVETAEISIQAALTGHLVLSTIHTNDAAGAIPRFLSMGVKPFLLAPALNAVVGQRLVRRICQACKVEDNLDEANRARVKDLLSQIPENSGFKVDLKKLKFYKGAGCEDCNGLGFKGRIGIYEVFTMNPDVEKLILSGSASEYDMRDVAVKHGMITMAQDGLLKALDGITSVEEVFSAAE